MARRNIAVSPSTDYTRDSTFAARLRFRFQLLLLLVRFQRRPRLSRYLASVNGHLLKRGPRSWRTKTPAES